MARYCICLLGALSVAGSAAAPEQMTLAQAEFHPYGEFVGKQGDRELH